MSAFRSEKYVFRLKKNTTSDSYFVILIRSFFSSLCGTFRHRASDSLSRSFSPSLLHAYMGPNLCHIQTLQFDRMIKMKIMCLGDQFANKTRWKTVGFAHFYRFNFVSVSFQFCDYIIKPTKALCLAWFVRVFALSSEVFLFFC